MKKESDSKKEIKEIKNVSIDVNFSIDNLSQKEADKIIDTFDKIQKDNRNKIKNYYLKTACNSIKQKGKAVLLNE